MPKKLCIVLGNGFTIDMLKYAKLDQEIDVFNLFRMGDQIPWPNSNSPGFLSFKHCPNLWNLGVRPNMSANDAMALLEDIITCVNVYAIKGNQIPVGTQNKPNDIYIGAYRELLSYLRNLFTYYNNSISNEVLAPKIDKWPWIDFIKRAVTSEEYESIGIVTYNYDIWLERALEINGINFSISNIETVDQVPKVKIYKPHGSISFYHRTQSPADYNISHSGDLIPNAAIDNYKLEKTHPLPQSKCIVNSLIPPAGDSERFRQSWAGQIKTSADNFVSSLNENDELMICGISYWHVDRHEIDSLITKCKPTTNVYMFNPTPNRSLNAVLTSIFSNYVLHSSSAVLKARVL
ncbi:hypothetical protein WP8W19C03_05360 [Aeromonas veronii]|uniref:SIR2 family protein n=1 Tax=Aeromonas veronii TaxID=654 RepID=UPI0015DC0880|nr:SIR2 family protein [Aeromonas veronii]BBT93842.1 hypothetical protein WP8W19C03_05360 [Aeromonas veronii]